MFWDFNVLQMACICVIEILCVMKKQNLEQNVEVHNYIAQKKLDLIIQFFNTDFFKVVNTGIKLLKKLPNHTKELDKYRFF